MKRGQEGSTRCFFAEGGSSALSRTLLDDALRSEEDDDFVETLGPEEDDDFLEGLLPEESEALTGALAKPDCEM